MMTAQTDPNDDRQFGLIGGVSGAGHGGLWLSRGEEVCKDCQLAINNRLSK
jgi:hypothetical protein